MFFNPRFISFNVSLEVDNVQGRRSANVIDHFDVGRSQNDINSEIRRCERNDSWQRHSFHLSGKSGASNTKWLYYSVKAITVSRTRRVHVEQVYQDKLLKS